MNMKALLGILLDFIFPPRCPVCRAYTERNGNWCPSCLAQTLRVRRLPLVRELAISLDGVWALSIYHSGMRRLILDLKYKQKKHVLPFIRTFLTAAVPELPEELLEADLAIPVPLYKEKEKKRGFNQAEIIFQDWLEGQAVSMQRILMRTRETSPQYGLSVRMRQENLKDAFAVSAGGQQYHIKGQRILLLDDIFTTGATLASCAAVLKKAGAQSVYALVLASDHS